MNTLLGIIEKFGNGKRNTQRVPLISFENGLTSPNKLTAKPTLNQMSNNKVTIINNKFPQKNSVRTVRKKMALTQFQLLIVQLYLIKIMNDKAMMISKKVTQKNYANTAKEKVVIMRLQKNNLMSLKGKRKRSITNINKVFPVMLAKKINQ